MHPPVHSGAVAPGPVSVPMVVVDSRPSEATKYYAEGGRNTGWILFSCGILAIILNVISIVFGSEVGVIGVGIWGGLLFFIPTGILGVCSQKKNTCVIVAYMVMAILSSLEGFVVFCMGMTAAFVSVDGSSYCYYGSYSCNAGGLVAVESLVSVTGFVAFITSIVAACFCCGGVCCGRHRPATHAVIHYYSGGTQAMVVTSMSSQNQQFAPGFGQPPGMQAGYAGQAGPYPSYAGHYPQNPGPYPPQPQHLGLSYPAPPGYQAQPSSSAGGFAPNHANPTEPKDSLPASPPPQYDALTNNGNTGTFPSVSE